MAQYSVAFWLCGLFSLQPIAISQLQETIEKTAQKDHVKGIVVNIARKPKAFQYQYVDGNMQAEAPYFLTSVTKLYTTAVVMKLYAEGLLDLDARIYQFFPANIVEDLHRYQGADYSRTITIRHLLMHTSGLPDYFQDEDENGHAWLADFLEGEDRSWTFEQAIARSKKLKTHFAPGESQKAYYSDTNFQLLGRIIEVFTGLTLTQAYRQYIFQPLGLSHTYLYNNVNDTTPAAFYHGNQKIWVPKTMASFGADGGLVSTVHENQKFTQAFFNAELFPDSLLQQMQTQWNKLRFSLDYGLGIMRFHKPRILQPFGKPTTFLGHSGISGAFAYYLPDYDAVITGTINQIDKPITTFRMLWQLADKFP